LAFEQLKVYVPEFESQLPNARLSVADFATQLSQFFIAQCQQSMPLPYTGSNMEFNVAGFNENEPYGRLYSFGIPNRVQPAEIYAGDNFGVLWGGQIEFVNRIVKGCDARLLDFINNDPNLTVAQKQGLLAQLNTLEMQTPIAAMPLQDCVDFAIFLIRTTERLTVGLRGCGGFIDVATITRRSGLQFVQRKKIRGESQAREREA
jgi:hypothetical protein